MRRFAITTTLAALCATGAFAQNDKLDRAIAAALPVCSDAKISHGEFGRKLPLNFSATVLRVESKDRSCAGQYLAVTTPTGGFFLGTPWFLDEAQGATIEEKLKDFTWKGLQQNYVATIDRTRSPYGLYKVTLDQMTERGKLPIQGWVDPDGKVFFFGQFRSLSGDLRADRAKAFEPFVSASPARGGANAAITILEFSDFECPSCKYAANFVDPIVAKHGDKVRYVRMDLPLITSHPWAFAAAVAGRAVHRQKPDVFWEYKKQIYANQDSLTAFTIDDFARNFAKDHDLDLTKYDADIADKALHEQILKGAGTAFSNDIRATPSYMVNGALVEPGSKGEELAAYVDKLLAGK
ncbi:MAG TPA: thioredoxin domain-containing protein [Thermoanaerobaculia bacterium]